ncbi:11568_t:CDS:2 [Funneliformis caledonium]|uniref:11568_t:CDS:1 n=1 Tax=Funneliformis caledonium TaxID=1117310 RepID=A0A9N9D434_9GLOM|nr:11568_t:CDS:2 [Funneliformis caledonium]
MPICVHKGCENTYEEEENDDNACLYHPLPPIFHEGLKGWQCCSRRVTTFDEFLAIPGCTRGRHTDQVEKPPKDTTATSEPEVPAPTTQTATRIEDGVEIYDSGPKIPYAQPTPQTVTEKPKPKPSPIEKEPEEDDLSIPVAPGTVCKRSSCGKKYVDDATSRDLGSEDECVYHPGTPIFHEGSKGWSCCSRKVLEFEEFLKIKGCKKGKHLFVGSGNNDTNVEEVVQCRHDWYQTPTHVIMSIFAKKVDKQRSSIIFKEQELNVDLKMPDGKRFKTTYALYQLIEPENSKYEILTTKVELKLKKANGISWPSLRSDEDLGPATTFGVQGGEATVGGKQYTLATDSPLYANK